MTWLFVALAAYFLISINLTLDKVILKNSLPHPVVYCFYMGILSIFGLVFAPFGVVDFSFKEAVTGLFVGAFFILPLYFMYKAVFANEATRVGPLIGAVTPIFVSGLSLVFLGEHLTWSGIIVFLLLVAGGFLISVELNGGRRNRNKIVGSGFKPEPENSRKIGSSCLPARYQNGTGPAGEAGRLEPTLKMLKTSILAALMFGIYFVLLKHVYNQGTFVSGFVWTRIGSFLASFVFLVSARNRKLIFGETKTMKPKAGVLVAANKTLSGVAFALLNYAIAIGSVSLVNAMQGLQYVFLLAIVAILSKKYPDILTETIGKKAITQKIIAIALIGIGLAMIAL